MGFFITNMKTALIIGATGLTGSHLLQILLADLRFEHIVIFVRRSTGIIHPKLEEHIVRFDHPEEWSTLVKGDVLFSTLGTTLKLAKDKPAQYQVDVTYQFSFAKAAASNNVPTYVIVSSAGANAHSLFFYLKMKGELENAVRELPFERIRILQPASIVGNRPIPRPFEKFSLQLVRLLNRLGLGGQFRPIEAGELSKALRNAALLPEPGIQVFRLSSIFDLADDNH